MWPYVIIVVYRLYYISSLLSDLPLEYYACGKKGVSDIGEDGEYFVDWKKVRLRRRQVLTTCRKITEDGDFFTPPDNHHFFFNVYINL